MTIRLGVFDETKRFVGYVTAYIGLETCSGPVTRMTEKTIWTRRPDGGEWMHRKYDCRLPIVRQMNHGAINFGPHFWRRQVNARPARRI